MVVMIVYYSKSMDEDANYISIILYIKYIYIIYICRMYFSINMKSGIGQTLIVPIEHYLYS